MKTLHLGFVTAAIAMLTAGAAHAGCVQADAAGRWTAYSFNSDDDVTRCVVSVSATGVVASTACTAFYGSSSTTVYLTAGRITLSDTTRCAFRGSLTIAGTVNAIRELTLSLTKATAQGIGTYPGGSFSFSMARY